MNRRTQWCNSQPKLPFLSQVINQKQCNLWSVITLHTKVAQGSSKWLSGSLGTVDSENEVKNGIRAKKNLNIITKGQKGQIGVKGQNDSRITKKSFPPQTDLSFSFYEEKCISWPLDDLWPQDRFVWKFSPHQFTSCPTIWNVSDIATESYCYLKVSGFCLISDPAWHWRAPKTIGHIFTIRRTYMLIFTPLWPSHLELSRT